MARHLERGEAAESLALEYLRQHGLRLLERNYRRRGGEIDLVMRQRDTLVFVEVRFRRDTRFGSAAESVTRPKQRKLLNTASQYLQETGSDSPCRFDVIGISGDDSTQIEWIQDAFRLN